MNVIVALTLIAPFTGYFWRIWHETSLKEAMALYSMAFGTVAWVLAAIWMIVR